MRRTQMEKNLLMEHYLSIQNFARDNLIRRSWTWLLVILNNIHLYHWFSKKQSLMETSSFGNEVVTMRQCCEYLKGCRYKLRMLGILVNKPCSIFGDNQSLFVVQLSQIECWRRELQLRYNILYVSEWFLMNGQHL